MNIWTTSPGACAPGDGPCRFGRFVTAAGDPAGALCEVRESADVVEPTAAASWYVPPGLALDHRILASLAAAQGAVLVAINGLAGGGIKAVRDAIPAERLVLALEASGEDELSVFEQLAWLSHQPEAFALAATDRTPLLAAAASGARDLIVAGEVGTLAGALQRIAAARRSAATRPLSPAEVDRLAERELCLTVRRALNPGDVLGADDLDVAVTEYRGLVPTLRDRVLGLRLRYAIQPGEALHFGHLHDGRNDEG